MLKKIFITLLSILLVVELIFSVMAAWAFFKSDVEDRVHFLMLLLLCFSIIISAFALIKRKNNKIFILGFSPLIMSILEIKGLLSFSFIEGSAFASGVMMSFILYAILMIQIFIFKVKVALIILGISFAIFFLIPRNVVLCEDGFYRNTDGKCCSCSGEDRELTTKSECNRCPNRTRLGVGCFPKCEEGKFLGIRNYNDDGYYGASCFECSEKKMILTNSEECAKCDNRSMIDDMGCFHQCGEDEFYDIATGCQPCSIKHPVRTTTKECAKCSNRSMEGERCVLNKTKPPEPAKVVLNTDKTTPYLRMCDFSEPPPKNGCILYVLNDTNQDKVVEDFFDEVSQKTQHTVFDIRLENPLYQKMIIPPGYFAEIIVPPLK